MESSFQDFGSFTHVPESATNSTRVNKRAMSSVVLSTKFGFRSYTIRPDSPRTKQALMELGIDKHDYFLKFILKIFFS